MLQKDLVHAASWRGGLPKSYELHQASFSMLNDVAREVTSDRPLPMVCQPSYGNMDSGSR